MDFIDVVTRETWCIVGPKAADTLRANGVEVRGGGTETQRAPEWAAVVMRTWPNSGPPQGVLRRVAGDRELQAAVLATAALSKETWRVASLLGHAMTELVDVRREQ